MWQNLARFRQASTVLPQASTPQVMMRQTAPGPIAGLRVWEPARFADVKFMQQQETVS